MQKPKNLTTHCIITTKCHKFQHKILLQKLKPLPPLTNLLLVCYSITNKTAVCVCNITNYILAYNKH